MYRLLATHGYEEQVFPVPESEARLGSASENDIVLRVTGVSRRHALVLRRPGGVEVVDLGSKNGLFVQGRRLERAVLTPGLRLQIGTAWLELQELSSSSETEFALFVENPQLRTISAITESAEPQFEGESSSCPEAALRLAYLVDRIGAGVPGERRELLARVTATLGAETVVTFELKRGEGIAIRERDGELLSDKDEELLAVLAGKPRAWTHVEVHLRRLEPILLAGRGDWFLASKFSKDALAREAWRGDFLRFLAGRLLVAPQTLATLRLAEALRVLALTGGNKSETARLLGITRQTLHTLLKRATSTEDPD